MFDCPFVAEFLLTEFNNEIVGAQSLGSNGSDNGVLEDGGTSESLFVGGGPSAHREVGVGCDGSFSFPTPHNQQRTLNSRSARTVAAKKAQMREDLMMAIAESVGISRKNE